MDFRLDLFESIFKRAQRINFDYAPPVLDSVLILTSELAEAAPATLIERSLGVLNRPMPPIVARRSLSNDADELSIGNLVLDLSPDLIVLQRHLLQGDHTWNRGFGGLVQSLIQHHSIPILVLPNHLTEPNESTGFTTVAAVVDQPLNNNDLVNWASTFCNSPGALYLHHIEAEDQFERTMTAIERIPELNSQVARRTLKRELMQEADRFLQHCQLTLQQYRPDLSVQYSVDMTRVQHGYLSWLEQTKPDLIVLDTLDATRALNRGIAGVLSLQFTDLPFLLL